MTCAPSAARPRTMASPMPLLAPVTTATFPVRPRSTCAVLSAPGLPGRFRSVALSWVFVIVAAPLAGPPAAMSAAYHAGHEGAGHEGEGAAETAGHARGDR